MDTDLRASLIASGAAAVLSILVGIVSGVEFLPLILRALVGGLVFGGVAFLALFLLRRFLPELFKAPEEAEKAVGGTVDIVLPGELPETLAGAEAREEPPEDAEAVVEAPVARRARRPPAPDVEGEVAEEAEAPLSEDGSPFVADSLLDGPPADEDEGAAVAAAASAAAMPLRGHDGMDDLDVLPDLESLSDGFSTSAEADGTAIHEYGDSERRPKEGGARGDADPAVLAQAVRTLLKRDQER